MPVQVSKVTHNNKGHFYRIAIDIAKEGAEVWDLTPYFKGRVGDDNFGLQIVWYYQGRLLDVTNKTPYIKGNVGHYSFDEKKNLQMAPDADVVTSHGKPSDCQANGQATYYFPQQMFPTDGIFKGFIGLEDENQNLTGVDIWFRVLPGVAKMGHACDVYVDVLDKTIADFKEKIRQQSIDFDAALQLELQKEKDLIQQKLDAAGDAMDEDTAVLKKLAAAVGAVQAQIDAKNIVTHQQFDDLSKEIVKIATETFTQPKAVASLNELQTAYPTGSEGVFVTTDTNHYYVWQDNSWHDCGEFFTEGIADGSIHLQKFDSSLQGAFTPDVTEVNIKLNNGFLNVKDNQVHSNKEVTQNSEGRYSDDIPVTPGEEYFVHGQSFWSGSLVVFRNNNGIVDFYPKNTLDHTVHTLRVVVPRDANTMVINTDSYTVPRAFKITAYNTFEQVVQNLGFLLDKKKLNFQDFGIQKTSQYGFWSHKDGAFHPLTPNDTNADIAYQPIKVSPLEVYRITGCSAWDARLYTIIDAQGNVISSYPDQEDQFKSIQTTVVMPANAAFLEINEVLPGATTKVEKATSVVSSGELSGMKWCAIGDSWTTIHADKGQGYVNDVAKELGIVADNAGGSGTGYMTKYKTEPFYQRKVSSDANVYTIFGSFNDAYNAKFRFGQSGDTGTDTFWGAIKATVDNIYSTNFDAQIGIIAPGPWGAINPHLDKNAKMSSLATFEDSTIGDMTIVEFAEKYVQTLHDFAKENSLPFLDLYHHSNLRPWDSNFINKYYHGSYYTDTTHPNAAAFTKFIAPKVAAFIKKIV